MVRRLLTAGARLDAPGGSALMVAVENARIDAAAALLAAAHTPGGVDAGGGAEQEPGSSVGSDRSGGAGGVPTPGRLPPPCQAADLDARDAQGWTAVAVAAGAGNARMLTMLLEAGASADARTAHTGRTPLMAAAQGGHTAAVQVLIRHATAHAAPLCAPGGGGGAEDGGGVGLRGGGDDGPGGGLARGGGGCVRCVRGGVRALVDAVDAQGVTALMLAAKNGHAAAAAALLSAGADATATDMAGLGALELCAKKGAVEVARLLLGRSIKPSVAPAAEAAACGLGSPNPPAVISTAGAATGDGTGAAASMLSHAARAVPIAARGGFVDLVRELGQYGAPTQPHLMRAAAGGATEVTKLRVLSSSSRPKGGNLDAASA